MGEMTRGFGQVVGGGGGRWRGDQFSPFQSAERGGRSLSFHVGHANRERQKGSSMPRIRTAVSGWTRKPEPLTVLWNVPRRPVVLALHDSREARSAKR